MIKPLVIWFFFFSFGSFAWEALEKWGPFLSQHLVINCGPEEQLCHNMCSDFRSCSVPASTCHNCIGTGIFLSFFYQEVGRLFVNNKNEIPLADFLRGLESHNFVLLTAKGPFNIFTTINDPKIENAFNSLCFSRWDSFPIVIGKLNQSYRLIEISAVICHGDEGAQVWGINSDPEVEIHLKNPSRPKLTLN